MNKSIRLHKEHGVNPTIPQCMYCGKDKNEIALLGAAYKGEAPMHMVLDIEPCDDCKEKFKGFVLLIVADEMGGKPQPTGEWAAMKREIFADLFTVPVPEKMCFIDNETFKMLKMKSEDAKENRPPEA